MESPKWKILKEDAREWDLANPPRSATKRWVSATIWLMIWAGAWFVMLAAYHGGGG